MLAMAETLPVIRKPIRKPKENRLLAALCMSDELLNSVASTLRVEYFDTKYARTIVSWILAYHSEHGQAPKQHITDIFLRESERLDSTIVSLLRQFLTNMNEDYGGVEINVPFMVEEAERFICKQAAAALQIELEQRLENDDVAGALALVEKFEKPKLGDRTYTLEDALYKPELGLVMTGPEFIALDIAPLKPILRPWIFEGDTILLDGTAGVGKTYFILEACRTAANGGWGMDGGWECEDPCKVLFVDGEMHPKRLQERMHLLKPNENFTPISKLHLGKKNVHLNLMDPKTRTILQEYIVNSGFKLVVLDNIFSLFDELDMQSDKEWSGINTWLNKLRGQDVVVVLVHHPNKANVQFGTITKTWNVTTTLHLNNAQSNGDENACFTISVTKGREKGLSLGGKTYRYEDGLWEVTESAGKDSPKENHLLAQVARGLVAGKQQNKIAEETGKSKSTISKWVSGRLLGVYLTEQDGIYIYTPKGEEFIDQWGFGI
jgi:hypothetical protein